MSLEKSQKILKAMWDKVAKPGADGNKYIVIKNRSDLEYHFWSGFVDDDKYTLQNWVDAFKESLLPNGIYLVTERQWMEKAEYHYSGPIYPPWDPMTIREGEWSEEDLDDLTREKIQPSVNFSKDDFSKVYAEVKKDMPKKDGKFLISRDLKIEWTTFINTYASPKRVLSIGVYQLKAVQQGQPEAGPLGPGSGFSKGPAAGQQVADKLSQLIGRRRN